MYTKHSDIVGRFGPWLGYHYFKERIEEIKDFAKEISIHTSFDSHITEVKKMQATEMMNTYKANTELTTNFPLCYWCSIQAKFSKICICCYNQRNICKTIFGWEERFETIHYLSERLCNCEKKPNIHI